MKKILFFLAMLASMTASAQNMQITPISATYTASPVITFKVGWTGARTFRHNTNVWVFVDYRKVENNAPAGSWTRAAVTATPAVNSTPASTATLVSGNDKGFWLHGTDGDYSATLTVPLTVAADVTQFSWCAYATDYPPNVTVHSNTSYTLHGAQPFVINGAALPVSHSTYSGTIISFTDATGAPGLFPAALDQPTNGRGCVAGLVENEKGICVALSLAGCNDYTLNLGAVSFTAGAEVQIVGNGISQIWSRPVTAEGCQKEAYSYGINYNDINPDCRTNPGYNGDLFSGCAVLKYAASICPGPWRVPTRQDFVNLLAAMGGCTNTCVDYDFIVNKIISLWGGEWYGFITTSNTISYAGSFADVMSQSFMISPPDSATPGEPLSFILIYSDEHLPNWWWNQKGIYGVMQTWVAYARAVRCVKS